MESGEAMTAVSWSLGAHEEAVRAQLALWAAAGIERRLWARDWTIWSETPRPELADRLGWLELHDTARAELPGLRDLALEARAEGIRDLLLLGMGGSSLAPEVFQAVLGNAPDAPALTVLDTTHPDAVRAVEARIDPARTWFVLASKSGTTLESLSLFRILWARTCQATARPGRHWLAVTDPGTPLGALARDRGFRATVLAPPDVGGRYSALSVFGLLPAALLGADPGHLLSSAAELARSSGPAVAAERNEALRLGAAMGVLARAGRDKLTLLTTPSLAAFPAWIEQLVAESTGKEGRGIIPVAGEPLGAPQAYGADRFFVLLTLAGEGDEASERVLAALERAGHPIVRFLLPEPHALGAEMLRWEIAVAMAGAVLGIQPFDQPDVQLAKDLARKAMSEGTDAGEKVGALAAADPAFGAAVRACVASVRPGDYVGIQAYLAPGADVSRALAAMQGALRDRLGVAATAGYGPRFLHSTGQLHKGGPNTGVFLQLVDEPRADVAVPETDFTLARLIRAQARGDREALVQRGRRVLCVSLGGDVPGGLARLAAALGT
jgi:transaldolase/glucose-6-phosphate isomerase